MTQICKKGTVLAGGTGSRLHPLTISVSKQLPVYGDDSNIRDWLYIEDHIRSINLVIHEGKIGETYNIGGNEEHANLDIVRRLCTSINGVFASNPNLAKRFPNAPAASGDPTSSLIEMVKDRPEHDWQYAVDVSHTQSELGFVPANEKWWCAILDDSYRSWIEDQYDSK